MDKKVSKITYLSPMQNPDGSPATWVNQKGKTMYNLSMELENGDRGTYSSEKPDGSVSVGDEVQYTVQVSGNYTNFRGVKKYTPYGGNTGAKKSGGYSRDVANEERLKAMGFGLSYAKDLVVAGKIEVKEMGVFADRFKDKIIEHVNQVESNK